MFLAAPRPDGSEGVARGWVRAEANSRKSSHLSPSWWSSRR